MGKDWRTLGNIERLISYYKMKAVTTIIELVVWRAKLGQADGNVTNRNKYCIEVPGPVNDTILEYIMHEMIRCK